MPLPTETIGGATGMIRPGGEQLRLLEQTFHDPLLSMTVQIHKCDSRRSRFAFFIRVLGSIPLGNRTWYFDNDGRLVETHTDSNLNRINTAMKEPTPR